MNTFAMPQPSRILASAAVLLAASIALHATPVRQDPATQSPATTAKPAQADDAAAARAGEQTTARVCTQCHDMDQVTQQRRTPADWKDTIDDMVSRGANATDAELADVTSYLTRHYGLVHVNTATADDLTAVLGLTKDQAKAVVDYRTANGKFANLAAIEAVPGIDKAKLEAQPDALAFD